jgi:D-amino peptidase
MKVYVVFDMEGCTGVSINAQTGLNAAAPSAYPRAQRMATDDVKAAIDGVLQVDKNAEILFNDAHANNTNVYFEEFPENVSIVTNSRELFDEVLGLDGSFDALVGIGVHGHPLTTDAVLCHNWNVREIKFNGKTLTETCLDASLAGYYGIPLVAITGDEATTKFIQENISPKIAAAPVKKGIGQYNAISLTPKKA